MATLRISPEVQRDLEGIKEYIETELENSTAAQNIVSKIVKDMYGLETFPDMGAPLSSIMEVQTDYRFLVSGKYLVFYRHVKGVVYVIRVLYGKRDYIKILFGDLPEENIGLDKEI